ncbi:MAG: hypothetical protein VYE62_09790, partial [Pseudomonadota bacterium]|nr:hypothetical protein [Pseudomonadota bacterium]
VIHSVLWINDLFARRGRIERYGRVDAALKSNVNLPNGAETTGGWICAGLFSYPQTSLIKGG